MISRLGDENWEAAGRETVVDDLSPLVMEAMAQARADVSAQPEVSGGRKAVPIRGLDDLDVDVSINIQLADPLRAHNSHG